jgi:hypothetical protein
MWTTSRSLGERTRVKATPAKDDSGPVSLEALLQKLTPSASDASRVRRLVILLSASAIVLVPIGAQAAQTLSIKVPSTVETGHVREQKGIQQLRRRRNLQNARQFDVGMLSLRLSERRGDLTLHLAGSRDTVVYPKPDFSRAAYTILNFPVDGIESVRADV